jgi:hypothetical protein
MFSTAVWIADMDTRDGAQFEFDIVGIGDVD